MQVIIFQNNEGGVSVVIPTDEALQLHTIQEVAVKDVPSGKPFKIIDASELPQTREQRDAWMVDVADLTDGIGGESNEFN